MVTWYPRDDSISQCRSLGGFVQKLWTVGLFLRACGPKVDWANSWLFYNCSVIFWWWKVPKIMPQIQMWVNMSFGIFNRPLLHLYKSLLILFYTYKADVLTLHTEFLKLTFIAGLLLFSIHYCAWTKTYENNNVRLSFTKGAGRLLPFWGGVNPSPNPNGPLSRGCLRENEASLA